MHKATGKVIKAFRRHLNYTQEFVAKNLNVTKETIANIENGRVSVDIKRLYQISILFKVSLVHIVSLASEILEKGNDDGLANAIRYLRHFNIELELAG